MDIISYLLIVIFSISVVVLAAIVIIHIIHAKKQVKSQMMAEYNLINPGDIYECKHEVDKYGYSKTNPYYQLRYQVIDKKDGWVHFKQIGPNGTDKTECTECYASIVEIISKKYKYINNITYGKYN